MDALRPDCSQHDGPYTQRVSANTGTDALTVVVLGFVGFRLFSGLQRSLAHDGRALVTRIVRGIRWRHVWPVPIVLTLVIVAATALIQIPWLQWGWWSALGGDGNPVFGSNDSTSGTVWEWLVPVAFMAMLVPALPLFAYAEERMFRAGAHYWSRSRRAGKVIQFGLVHALIGIPIGTALALSIGGAYFMSAYLRSYTTHGNEAEATLESARAHTAYNALIVVIIVLATIVDTVTSA